MKIMRASDYTEEDKKGRMDPFMFWWLSNDPEFETAKETDFFYRVEREVQE